MIEGVNELVVTMKGKADCFPLRSFFGIKVFAVQIVEISSCQNTARFEWPDDLQINHEEEELIPIAFLLICHAKFLISQSFFGPLAFDICVASGVNLS
jgi:hypothetical protein